MKLVASPYIKLLKRREEGLILVNYFTNKTQFISFTTYKVIKYCRQERSFKDLAEHFRLELINKALEQSLIFDTDKVWKVHCLQRAEIETISACNWQCRYCPQHTVTREKSVMGMDLFCDILDKCVRYGKFNNISFHHYSEPTLDPFFYERLLELKKRNMIFELFTNGKELNEDKIKFLHEIGIVNKIVFNFPSADPDEYQTLTGSDCFDLSRRAIERCCTLNLPVYVTVLTKNGINKVDAVRKLFPKASCNSFEIQDRAGSLKDDAYNLNISIKDPLLYGCFYFLHILYVTVKGDVIPCVNDSLNHQYVFGNLKRQEIAEILESKNGQKIKQKIFGSIPAEEDFQCRRCVFMSNRKDQLNKLWEL